MNDICNFIPPKKHNKDLCFYHFVYETALKKLRQPFCNSTYRINLVVKGKGFLKANTCQQEILPGTLFFTFPNDSYEIDGTNDFTYLYISFDGVGADTLLNSFGITKETMVYHNYRHLVDFWMDCVRQINHINANTLTESVVMYSLSFINNIPQKMQKNKFDLIIEYLDNNFTSKNLSIRKVAELFFYSEKYLSALFKKKTNVKFTEYINNMHIEYALKLMETDSFTVSELASKCGFSDPFYFSKVFKRATKVSPTEYIKNAGRSM